MFHHESWKLIYLGSKDEGQGHEAQNAVPACVLHSCECWLLLFIFILGREGLVSGEHRVVCKCRLTAPGNVVTLVYVNCLWSTW